MRFRLSLRFALFASENKRVDNFRLMKTAYDLRSTIVHGGVLEGNAVKVPDKGKIPLSHFVDTLEDELRAALLKAIGLTPDGKTLVDWEALAGIK